MFLRSAVLLLEVISTIEPDVIYSCRPLRSISTTALAVVVFKGKHISGHTNKKHRHWSGGHRLALAPGRGSVSSGVLTESVYEKR